MNPDGYESALVAGASGRYNAKGVDLNRNFPSRLKGRVPKQPIQPESQAIMAWSKAIPFVLSANLHGGTNLGRFALLFKKVSFFSKLSMGRSSEF